MAASDWLPRALLTAGVVVAIVCSLVLMRRGWLRRSHRQASIAALPDVPTLSPPTRRGDVSDVEARYLGANRSGDWLDRVVAHGLGAPSQSTVSVRADAQAGSSGVWVSRRGAPDLYLPADEVRGARHDRAAAGRAYGAGGVLLISWHHGDELIDLGLRIRDADQAEQVRAAVDALANLGSTTGEVA